MNPARRPATAGSSPLARGLRVAPGGGVAPPRIIPARAGFTNSSVKGASHKRDHPRSRGVYSSKGHSDDAGLGSSPLARGLPTAIPHASGSRRIIPARAGFTPKRWVTGRASQDHPRSRGVYPSGLRWCAAVRGSSPLARGLPRRRARWVGPLGIIPARAGFTGHSRRCGEPGPDHPRSRGVYRIPRVHLLGGLGSSPLARGLHTPPTGGQVHHRIIPARAGFTRQFTIPAENMADHPRSRGVYGLHAPGESTPCGSSPLARGLLEEVPHPASDLRIIPARAGFTWSTWAASSEAWDHPRSRGVYTCGSLESQR